MLRILAQLRDLFGAAAKVVFTVARRFYDDRCLLQASALAYTSLLSIVPLLALMFSVLKGLGVQQRLEPLLLSRLALDPEVAADIIGFIDRTNVSTLGALGAVALLLTVISLLGSIEGSLNSIWRVEKSRSLLRKATDYLSVVLLTPFLLLAAVAITSSLQEQTLLRWVLQTEFVGEAVLRSLQLAPMAINSLALMILYAVMPNRRPRLPAIFVGAALAGVAWQVVQWSYVSLQIGVARYNAIYGALSQLPVTLVWLYVSWLVVLAGAELAAVLEFGAEVDEDGVVSRRAVALQVLLRAAECFRGTGGAVEPHALAEELTISPTTVREVCNLLSRAGCLAVLEGDERRFVLGRDPAVIQLGDVDAAIATPTVPPASDARVRTALATVQQQQNQLWHGCSLADLLDDRGIQGSGARGKPDTVRL